MVVDVCLFLLEKEVLWTGIAVAIGTSMPRKVSLRKGVGTRNLPNMPGTYMMWRLDGQVEMEVSSS